ncbi:tetratricopeptide repeat protein [Lysobacter alkalisoli]|uniref:Tetratricopeptide repeat protein n=2 Tax=Marilutibacter alkalisoli TaxID=2591633 RepID=A0A514BWN1_9GAMM|nr:tetratricopeptide repeat protein [Lysobacter alkalisoli]
MTGLYNQAEFEPGTVLAGRFRIESLLGVGGMGVVYRATDIDLDVTVAVKLLRPELAHRPESFERFRSELLLARQVSNPHVVRIHDLARHQEHWLISMDFVDGAPLDRVLDRRALDRRALDKPAAGHEGAFAVDDALRIARQLAEGLGAAHAKGVIHRDLKPANVLLDADGNAYISDFGVARSLATSGLTRSGTIVGTPDYLSPEQARGDPVDARSDLYALGLILYEMLTGAPPFSSGTLAEVLAQRMVRTPRPVTEVRSDVPAWVARLLDKLLRPQPAHRFKSAAEVIAAIDRREVPRELRPGRGLWLGLAAALAVAAGSGLWWWQHDHDPTIAVQPPLQRVLVLPIQPGPGTTDAPGPERMTALGAHLRDALANADDPAVVDRDRTIQALRQLDPVRASRPDMALLHGTAASQRILQPQLTAVEGGWQISAQLHEAGGGTHNLEGPIAATPAAALNAWGRQRTTRRALDLKSPVRLDLPEDSTALDAYGAGLIARDHGRLDAAIEQLRAATTAAPDYASAWLAEAETAQAIGEVDGTWDAIERAGKAATDAPERLRRRLAADAALLDGDAPAAVSQWRAQLQASPDDTFAQLQLARAQGFGGDFAAAVATAQALTQRDGNDPRAWYELGKFSILSGDARRAVDEYLVRALVLYKRSRNTYGEAETVNALGIGYARLGQIADATEQYRKAVELRRTVGNRRGVATSLGNLANVLALTGHHDEAADNLQQARTLYTELNDRAGLAAVENELGLLKEERGDYGGALAAFRDALQSWQQIGDLDGSAQALNNIGFSHYQLGAYDDAQVYWQQAADAYRGLGSETGAIRTMQNLGLLDTARGRWDDARQRLEDSLARAERQQMPEEAAVSRRNLAELEWLQGHLGAAITQAEAAQALFRQREDRRGMADAGLLKAQALRGAHAGEQARQELETLIPLLDDASAEQRAIAELIRAELARDAGDAAGARAAFEQARQHAADSGVRLLQLQTELHLIPAGTAAPGHPLDTATARLGHATLRLAWLERLMRDALARNDPAQALDAYREASSLLRNGDHVGATRIHRLAATAHDARGDTANRDAAEARTRAALDTLRDSLPEPLKAGFDEYRPPTMTAAGPAS